jgi:peptidyl-prolyl cis-trans isomerase SurA
LIFSSCAPEQSEIVVAKYGGNEIKMKEFEDAYAKNAGGYENAKDDSLIKFENFLDLYVNFKMKLRDAYIRGYQNDKILNDELIDYKKKVGVTYILEKQIVEPGIEDLYEKRKYELRVSHLMLRPDSAMTDEQAAALSKVLLDSIKAGANFEEMVKRHSSDNFSKEAGGDIFYVTAGQLPVEFEDAAYATPEGTVYPEVVKTRYGYHLIKVTEKRERTPQIKASHILVDVYNDSGAVDSAEALSKVQKAYALVKDGGDFAEVVRQYSDDSGTKDNGGDLGFFERRMMVKEFDEAAFNLNVGEVSDIVKTNYGYHIIKVTEKTSLQDFETSKEELKKIFRNTRYNTIYDELVSSLRTKYNYKEENNSLSFIADRSDSLKFGSEHPKYEEFKDMAMFSYAGKTVSAGEFMEKTKISNDYQGKFINMESLTSALNKISSDYLLEEEAIHLEESNKEFAALMEDYKNGIYIFKLQEDEVWNKVQVDSTKLYEFYQNTKENYKWPDRVSYSEIFSKKDSVINHYYSLLQKGENFDSLAVHYTERIGYKEKAGNFGLQDIASSKLAEEASKLQKPGEYTAPIQTTSGYSIVRLNDKESARLKTFEEAKAEVSGAFQEFESKRLEQVYLENLKKKYEPELYFDKLEEAFKSSQ